MWTAIRKRNMACRHKDEREQRGERRITASICKMLGTLVKET
jgi:hypothetical protein